MPICCLRSLVSPDSVASHAGPKRAVIASKPVAMISFPEAARLLASRPVKNTFLEFPDISNIPADEDLAALGCKRAQSAPPGLRLRAIRVPPVKPAFADRMTAGPASQANETGESTLQQHEAGRCKPCRFFALRSNGCSRGSSCPFCHFCSGEAARRDHRKASRAVWLSAKFNRPLTWAHALFLVSVGLEIWALMWCMLYNGYVRIQDW